MSRILLKTFAVPNKQPSWNKFKIPRVPILVTHIIKLLVTAPSAPITTVITDTLLQLHIFFVFPLLSPGSGRPFLVLFLQFEYQKNIPHRWFGTLCSSFPIRLYRAVEWFYKWSCTFEHLLQLHTAFYYLQ